MWGGSTPRPSTADIGGRRRCAARLAASVPALVHHARDVRYTLSCPVKDTLSCQERTPGVRASDLPRRVHLLSRLVSGVLRAARDLGQAMMRGWGSRSHGPACSFYRFLTPDPAVLVAVPCVMGCVRAPSWVQLGSGVHGINALPLACHGRASAPSVPSCGGTSDDPPLQQYRSTTNVWCLWSQRDRLALPWCQRQIG